MLANRANVVTKTPFVLIIMAFCFPLPGTQNSSDLSSCRTNTLSMFFRSFSLCAYSLFWNIFFCAALVFSNCCSNLFSAGAKMGGSIIEIEQGGVSQERVVVKDSNDWSGLPGHWSLFCIGLTLREILWESSSSCLSADTRSSPQASCLDASVAEELTIVTDSYIPRQRYRGVSHLSHADSMSPTETSTLSLTTISTASKNFFFLVYNYRCCSYAFFCCLATTTSSLTWLKKPLAPDLPLFSQEWKKGSCSLRSNCILIFQTYTFRGSIPFCDPWQSYALMQ